MSKTFQQLVESWFMAWLMGHRGLSPRTVASYRDTFRLLLRWLREERGVASDDVGFEDLGREDILEFLSWLSDSRGCSAKTVNCRLGAIRSFADYVASECPERSAWAKSVRAIKPAKVATPALDFLTVGEVNALVGACDAESAEGRRDAMMVKLLFNTGFRVSELVELRASSFDFTGERCHITVVGKGRKERTVPIWDDTRDAVASYMDEHGIEGDKFLFPGRNVSHLTRSGARARLDAIVKAAAKACPSIGSKSVSPHTLRHSTAMAMLAAGIDLSTIALWLGHESVQTTHKYMVADMEMKERALERALGHNPFGEAEPMARYVADEGLLAFLASL